MKKPGCPFNRFGPCLEEKCRFYLDTSERGSECAITASAVNSHLAYVTSELVLQVANLAGHCLNLAGRHPPASVEYVVLQGFADAYTQLASSPAVSDSARKRLVRGQDEIRRILAALYPDEEDDE